MAWVTAALAFGAFVCGCITLVIGFRVGHGEDELAAHLSWGLGTLLLQLFAASVAAVHARAGGRGEAAAALAAAGERRAGDAGGPPPAAGPGGAAAG